eukprot:Gb_18788 [translate_table: standard]
MIYHGTVLHSGVAKLSFLTHECVIRFENSTIKNRNKEFFLNLRKNGWVTKVSLESVFGCRCLRTSLKWKNCRAQHVMAMTQTLKNHNKMILIHGPWFDFQCSKCTIKTATVALKREGNSCNSSPEDVTILCEQGRLKEVLHILDMLEQHVDTSTYICLLQVCIKKKSLSEGKLVHAHMNERGFMPDRLLTTLVNMYAKCGGLVDARRVFNGVPKRDAFSWNVMIAAYTKYGFPEEALVLFHQMRRTGVQPNQFTFSSVLPACADLVDLKEGMEIHEEIIRDGFESDVFVGNVLVDMYVKCGSIENARHLFDKMPQRDVISWTAMIAAYSRHAHSEEALVLFCQMQRTGIQPNQFTFASVLTACSNLAALEQGMEIHKEIIRSGFQIDVFVGSSLVEMYAKCGIIEKACNLFDRMPQRDAVSWNTMIAGYTQNGLVDEALKVFQAMPKPDVVSWNVMIAGYTQNGQGVEALNLFQQMQQTGVNPDSRTFASVLPACANLATLEQGMEIHEQIITNGFHSDAFVESALVDMYAKCGSIEKARRVFDKMHQRNTISWTVMIAGYTNNGLVDQALKIFQEMPKPDVVSWTAMIAGYVQNGQGADALKLFQQMQLAGVKPNSNTFASILPACANLASLEQAMEIHEDIIRSGFQSDVFVESALLDMYAKCGKIKMAHNLFVKMHQRSGVSWTAMIAGYAMHGCSKEALELFEQMQYSGIKPNQVTLLCVLSACRHAGLVDEGRQYFDCMSKYYHITPAMEHYACMVDLLGRAGRLDEAQEFINKMPIKPDATVWSCLLGACRIYSNIELGEHAAKHLFLLDSKNTTPYVLLSSIYAAAGRWDDSENVWRMMKERRVEKMPGCSWIEVDKQVHAFLVGDRSHPQTKQIYAELERLSTQMKVAGYVPNTRFVLHDVEDEQKEQILCYHSEKLAIAFGLINTSPGTAIRIIKNLRVCSDCHSATKFISKIVAREIVVRDSNRYHHFKDGWCCCGDYW